jgi:hypothetical protein
MLRPGVGQKILRSDVVRRYFMFCTERDRPIGSGGERRVPCERRADGDKLLAQYTSSASRASHRDATDSTAGFKTLPLFPTRRPLIDV